MSDDNVIQIFGTVRNPALAELDEKDFLEERKPALLEAIDALREAAERGEVAGLHFFTIAAPGHDDMVFNSEGLFDRPAVTAGIMGFVQHDFIAAAREDRPLYDYED